MITMSTTTSVPRDAVRYRPATPADVPFLRYLYATTRENEMSRVPWTEEQKAQFMDLQFAAQKAHYEDAYPDCEFLVIEHDGESVGRLYIDRGPKDIEIVDIALLPHYRGRGLGRVLLQEILDEGQRVGKAVTIFVEHNNPARHLYDRLEFVHVDTNGVYHHLVWSPKP